MATRPRRYVAKPLRFVCCARQGGVSPPRTRVRLTGSPVWVCITPGKLFFRQFLALCNGAQQEGITVVCVAVGCAGGLAVYWCVAAAVLLLCCYIPWRWPCGLRLRVKIVRITCSGFGMYICTCFLFLLFCWRSTGAICAQILTEQTGSNQSCFVLFCFCFCSAYLKGLVLLVLALNAGVPLALTLYVDVDVDIDTFPRYTGILSSGPRAPYTPC